MTLAVFVLSLIVTSSASFLNVDAAVGTRPGYVYDTANVMSLEDKNQFEDYLREVDDATTAEIVIYTIPSLIGHGMTKDGAEIQDTNVLANYIFNHVPLDGIMGIGKKGKDNGLLVLLSLERDLGGRSLRIEIGKGLEGTITNDKAGRILESYLVPARNEYEKSGNAEALVQALSVTITVLASDLGYTGGIYQDKANGVQLQYPPNWRIGKVILKPIDLVWFAIYNKPLFGEPRPVGNLFISVTPSLSMNASDKATQIAQSLSQYPGFQITDSGPTEPDGRAAFKIVTRQEIQSVDMTNMFVIMVEDGKAYVVKYSTQSSDYGEHLEEVNSALVTLRIDSERLTVVSGNYSINEIGLKIEVPDGWAGISMSNSTNLLIYPPQTLETANGVAALEIVYRKLGEPVSSLLDSASCNGPYQALYEQTKTGLYLAAVELECTQNDKYLDFKDIQVVTESHIIHVTLFGTSKDPFTQHLKQFEEAIETLAVTNAINPYSETGLKTVRASTAMYPITLNAKEQKLALSFSNVSVSDFAFDQDEKKLSLTAQSNSHGREHVDFPISQVLNAPYAVTDNGQELSDYWIVDDRVNNVTRIQVDLDKGSHSITIIGASVVPEFHGVIPILLVTFSVAAMIFLNKRIAGVR